MKKFYFFVLALIATGASAQVTVTNAVVPQYTQGKTSTNNSRTPFWFWAELGGLTPGATYRVFAGLDTLNASATSNGAGNPYLINMLSSTFRRTTNATMANPLGHDSLTADVSGKAWAWFGVEPTANGRFTPGDTVYPKIMLNNGAGGIVVATRVFLTIYPIYVINYGTVSGNAAQGSALYDSAIVSLVPAKSFAALYDNTAYTGRPLSFAVVEDDGMDLFAVTSVANFYQNLVDTMPQRWGTIIPNANVNGVRGLQYFDFYNGAVISPPQYTDNDGNWCSGAITTNPANGGTAVYLNSNFSLMGTVSAPDTLQEGAQGSFSVTTNGVSPGFSWDFGDGSALDTNQNAVYTYTASGTYTVTVTIQTPYCGIAYTHTVLVTPGTTGINAAQNSNYLQVSPNPGNGLFYVNTKSSESKMVRVLNALGEVVIEKNTNERSFSLDLGSCAPGMYWLRVSDAKGNSAVQKILNH